MTALSLLAPAKLNLFLHVTGRRADGYHELQTLFQLLDYGDRLHFAPQENGVISLQVRETGPASRRGRGDNALPPGNILPRPAAAELADTGQYGRNTRLGECRWDTRRSAAHSGGCLPLENNLVLRAAVELARRTGHGHGISITLEKHLPIGGGLGGGSSNAAVSLLALNKLWRLGLSTDALCRIGVGLGADVPVFIRGRSAWGEGVGDLLEPLALPEQWYLVVTPPCQVSTAMVFNDENLTRNSAKIRIADFLAGRCRNDCEPVARRLYPAVDEAFAWLGRFDRVRMSGTGASVFISLADEAAGKEILAGLPAGWNGFAAKGIDCMEHVREN